MNAANDPDNPMTESIAASAIFQLLIAGSDSSATSMGNALKMLIENPKLAEEIRNDMEKLANSLLFDGAEAILAGCTEIPLCLSPAQLPVPLLSSTELLVRATIREARGTLLNPE